MNILFEPIAKAVWENKYRYRLSGTVLDGSIEETWKRVAHAVAKAEKKTEQKQQEDKFYQLLEGFNFLPGGRILAGAGTKHKVTLFNCFVMNIAKDSLAGIFSSLKEGALTLQQGGGIGYDFSVLRPQGALVKKTGLASSGPVSFMRVWDTMCNVLLSTGARRGAMMAVMRCDHPDIVNFVTAKRDPHELRHFNVSVMVSDAFMQAVKQDAAWPLVFPEKGQVYRTINARELWQLIIRSAYEYAEPGVLFGDTINRMNNLWYREHITATNPCGEIPLPSYGACNLGAINLTQFVIAPYTKEARLDMAGIEETAINATRFLDNVIAISHYPLAVQRKEAHATRRIGLGLTGLADALVMLGLRYGEAASLTLASEVMQRIAHATWHASIELARERGGFPAYAPEYLQGEFFKKMDASIQTQVAKYGVRNSHHNTIAPTGTISLLANNVSNGIEPIFHAEYDRHMRQVADDEMVTFRVKDYAYQRWLEFNKNNTLPEAWVDTHDLTPSAHLRMQGAMQPYIDNAISKTINIPVDFPFEKLHEVYTEAYELGLKGCTVFRPNPVTGSVLEIPEEHCCQFEGGH